MDAGVEAVVAEFGGYEAQDLSFHEAVDEGLFVAEGAGGGVDDDVRVDVAEEW